MATFLVLGATGKTGSRVTHRLLQAGHSVRTAARSPQPPGGRSQPVLFDWSDPGSHEAALAGVEAVYIVPPAFVVDVAPPIGAFVERARQAGVARAVLLSARGVDADDSLPLRQAELGLLASGLEAAIVRPSWFNQNFSEGVFAAGVRQGVLSAPAGDGLEPFIDAEDIAEVAASLLQSPALGGAAYDLSGPEALSFAQAAAVIGQRLGRPVRYEDVAPADYLAGAIAAGLPPDYAELLGVLFALNRSGADAGLSDGVEQVLGRPARSLAAWADRELAPDADLEAA